MFNLSKNILTFEEANEKDLLYDCKLILSFGCNILLCDLQSIKFMYRVKRSFKYSGYCSCKHLKVEFNLNAILTEIGSRMEF